MIKHREILKLPYYAVLHLNKLFFSLQKRTQIFLEVLRSEKTLRTELPPQMERDKVAKQRKGAYKEGWEAALKGKWK